MKFPYLKFYYYDSCPFCNIVLNFIQNESIKVDYCNILNDTQHREQLIKDTGKKTVPCLYIDDKPMHESSDILQWLQNNLDHLAKA